MHSYSSLCCTVFDKYSVAGKCGRSQRLAGLSMRSTKLRIARPSVLYRNLALSSLTPIDEAYVDDWTQHVSKKSLQFRDEVSRSKLEDLYVTLPTRSHTHSEELSRKQILDPLHTLIFFHPRFREIDLGADGTDATFCPPAPFQRRMWAGGSFTFSINPQQITSSGLRVGCEAVMDTRIMNVSKKGFKKGLTEGHQLKNPMVFVEQELTYYNEGKRTAEVVERRSHVYLPIHASANERAVKKVESLPEPQFRFSWTPTPTTLFRFSALTWNSHLIHLDRDYACKSEGYPERLVHGPLTALMLMEFLLAPSSAGGGSSILKNRRVASFTYRAINPVIVNRQQHLCGSLVPVTHPILSSVKEDASDVSQTAEKAFVWAEDDEGTVGMIGVVNLAP